MRIVITQGNYQLSDATEAFLMDAIAGLQNDCDSLCSCRAHVQGEVSATGKNMLGLTLVLSTNQHDFTVRVYDGTDNALAARDAICSAVGEARNELHMLKLTEEWQQDKRMSRSGASSII